MDTAAKQTKSGINDAVLTPVSDLNLRRKKIPPLLKSLESAYGPVTDNGCDSISELVTALDAVLGPDLNELQPTTRGKGKKAGSTAAEVTLETVAGTAGSIIPLRGIVRRVTGASKHDQRVAAAYRRGSERRAFLKGMGTQLRCEWPAAPREANSVVSGLRGFTPSSLFKPSTKTNTGQSNSQRNEEELKWPA